ncbi:MAG: exodeoxyribonuclease V subunit alpha [Geodermatophilaceae bacterium]|nr:exodeoxyribonuclease V subunit alpha [Geodermatophilaceae bacterium]
MSARGALAAFNDAGVLDAADVHVALRLSRLGGETDEAVLLAVALAVRAVRLGSVCVDLLRLREVNVEDVDVAALPWPLDAVAPLRVSPLVVGGPAGALRPLRLVDTEEGPLLYLERYFRQEQTIRQFLDSRSATAPPYDAAVLASGLAAGFPAAAPDRQRVAGALAVTRWTSVVTGGPGTGKTFTIARIIALLQGQEPGVRVALAAPTGKAAARLEEKVGAQGLDLRAMTLHRLLGWRPGSSTRFRHDASNRLPYDVVVVDECSMVSLTMMARLVEAVRPDARLVLVGDADQLASIDAGAVLGDLVARPSSAAPDAALTQLVGADLHGLSWSELVNGVVRLARGYRFEGAIAALADAVRNGDADAALDLLKSGDPSISFHAPGDVGALREDVVRSSAAVTEAALAGDVPGALAALEEHRLLCAHREGPYGVSEWDHRAREWVQAATGRRLDPWGWYPGQPLLVTANDYDTKVYNGDTGVVMASGDGLVAVFPRAGSVVRLHPSRLASVQTVYAMTIHRSQGSQYRRVSVVLPAEASALLTRELLYTAITRAREHVRVVGTEESVRAGVQRQVLRASGLRRTAIT